MKILVDGLNHCTNADYHADRKYLSSSVLKVIYTDLAAYKDKYLDGNPGPAFGNQGALDEGSLTHAMLLDPATLKTEYSFYPGLRKQGEDFEAFKAAVGTDKLIISKPQRLRVEQYVEACRARPEAMAMLSGGFPEQTICGELHGVPIKVRFDYVNVEKGELYDVKTTGYPADIESFKQTLTGLKYQLSAALYCSMAENYYGKPFTFYFIVISKKDLVCHVYKTSAATRAEGDAMVKTACEKYLTAKQINVWSEALEPDTITISTPTQYEILEV